MALILISSKNNARTSDNNPATIYCISDSSTELTSQAYLPTIIICIAKKKAQIMSAKSTVSRTKLVSPHKK